MNEIWFSTSERLPEKSGYCFVTNDPDNITEPYKKVWFCPWAKITGRGSRAFVIKKFAYWAEIPGEYYIDHTNHGAYHYSNGGGLTYEEQSIMDDIISAWDKFIKLEKQHPSDINEFGDAIHRLQGLLAMRPLRRQYPKYWISHE